MIIETKLNRNWVGYSFNAKTNHMKCFFFTNLISRPNPIDRDYVIFIFYHHSNVILLGTIISYKMRKLLINEIIEAKLVKCMKCMIYFRHVLLLLDITKINSWANASNTISQSFFLVFGYCNLILIWITSSIRFISKYQQYLFWKCNFLLPSNHCTIGIENSLL